MAREYSHNKIDMMFETACLILLVLPDFVVMHLGSAVGARCLSINAVRAMQYGQCSTGNAVRGA
jgi:hypothetical protein